MDNPDAVVVVDGDAGDLPEDPSVGQRFGPERLDHVLRDAVALRGNLNAEEGADEDEDGGGGRQHRSVHGRSPSW